MVEYHAISPLRPRQISLADFRLIGSLATLSFRSGACGGCRILPRRRSRVRPGRIGNPGHSIQISQRKHKIPLSVHLKSNWLARAPENGFGGATVLITPMAGKRRLPALTRPNRGGIAPFGITKEGSGRGGVASRTRIQKKVFPEAAYNACPFASESIGVGVMPLGSGRGVEAGGPW